jgi:Cu-processing system permease protein
MPDGETEPTTDGGVALDGAEVAETVAGDAGEAGTSAEDPATTAPADESETAHAADADTISVPLPRPGIVARIARRETRLTTRRGWTVGLTVVFSAFGFLLATFSGSGVAPTGYEPVVASYVELATFLVPLAALAFGHGAVVGPS